MNSNKKLVHGKTVVTYSLVPGSKGVVLDSNKYYVLVRWEGSKYVDGMWHHKKGITVLE